LKVQRKTLTELVGPEFFVAKSIPSRMPATDSTYRYTYTDDNSRSSSLLSGDTPEDPAEAQVMTPPFTVGDSIFVESVNYSLVVVETGDGGDGVSDLKYIEASTEREWTCPIVAVTT